ncbi:NAD(P)H-dependent oxidoreductase subunit E [Caballeronia sp. DA-9]|uniref:NAD(P)H-dependent oxidoreductase subunit E n=1 Tax=Caballeronia sp. DA-9 TaxID=3436237 RepID=UPI003F675A2B
MIQIASSHQNDPALTPDERVARHLKPGASLIAVLHAIQDEAGYVPADVIGPLAQAMSLSRAEVHGVITYYHHFRSEPPARVTVQLCRAEACKSMGTEALAAHIEGHTDCKFDSGHHTDTELETVYCLGQCALSPAMTINGELYARVTPQKFDRLYEEARVQSSAEDLV